MTKVKTMLIYCIHCERMVRVVDLKPSGNFILCHDVNGNAEADAGDVCCLPDGFAFCEPPEYDAESFVSWLWRTESFL